MSLPLHYRIVGYRTLAIAAPHVAALLDLCRRHDLPYTDFQNRADGSVALTFTRRTSHAAEAVASSEGIPLTVVRTGGLPAYALALLRRPGLIVGALLGICFYLAATRVVWDIRITGNQAVSDRSIEETLAACGFTIGTPLRGFRADVTENTVLLYDDRLAWLSINRRGTVAYVEVREATHTPPPATDAPADIVASVGGIIERVELSEGNVRVTAGQTVSPGDVLVSGLYDSDRYGIRYTRAVARVYARTVREITVEVPLTYEQKNYLTAPDSTLADICQEKLLIFFGKSIKFSKKTGNEGVVCDTIEREQIMSPVSGVGFPISVRTVWHLPYEMITVTRTHAEAEELAYVELARRISAIPGGAELLGKTIRTTRTPDAFILTCTLTAVEDIGTVREIEIGN